VPLLPDPPLSEPPATAAFDERSRAFPSAVEALAAHVVRPEAFFEQWLGAHLSISVLLYELRLPGGSDPTMSLREAEAMQDALFELRELAQLACGVGALVERDRRMREAIARAYAWLDGTLRSWLHSGPAPLERPSFHDIEVRMPSVPLLLALHALHPRFETLAEGCAVGLDPAEGKAVARRVRALGTAALRLAGRPRT
jgi:hypothetical protein